MGGGDGRARPGFWARAIEQNAIALLSNHRAPVDPPSEGWLGHHSERDAICSSGLWNLDYVDGDYDPASSRCFKMHRRDLQPRLIRMEKAGMGLRGHILNLDFKIPCFWGEGRAKR